jgi:hypothetical protein
LRDLLLELAANELFRAKWTNDIHDEWIRSVLGNRPDLKRVQLARTRELMDQAVMDCLVEEYQNLIPTLSLPDADDRHVLAAAIRCGAKVIVTFDLKHFPDAVLAKYGVEARHPDDFLHQQFGLNPASVLIAARRCRARLKKPPRTAGEYLDRLEAQSLAKTVAELRPFASSI